MTNRTDADLLQVLLSEVREDLLVDLVVSERRLVFFEAQAPQPSSEVHDKRAPKTPHKASSFRSKGQSRAT